MRPHLSITPSSVAMNMLMWCLPDKNFNLPQLRHYFFGFGTSVRHF